MLLKLLRILFRLLGICLITLNRNPNKINRGLQPKTQHLTCVRTSVFTLPRHVLVLSSSYVGNSRAPELRIFLGPPVPEFQNSRLFRGPLGGPLLGSPIFGSPYLGISGIVIPYELKHGPINPDPVNRVGISQRCVGARRIGAPRGSRFNF